MAFSEKRAARRYSHNAIAYRHCGYWWCLGCHCRKITGEHVRRRQRIVARMAETSKTLTPIRITRDADGQIVRHTLLAECKCTCGAEHDRRGTGESGNAWFARHIGTVAS